MPRKPRIEFPGAFYHVICRGNNQQEIFSCDDDYKEFLKSIEIAKSRYGFILYCYNLIPNHFHLLVETMESPLSRIMCSLLTRYARHYNIVHNRSGHVFERRYKAILCQKENYLLELIRYIHLNDARAGLTDKPGKWKWSSYRTYIGKEHSRVVDIYEVLGMFSKNIAIARNKFAEFIYDGIDIKQQKEFYPPDTFPCLGDEDFIDDLNKKYGELRHREKVRVRISLDELAQKISQKVKVSIDEIKGPSKKTEIVLARKLFSWIATYYAGHKMTEISKFLGYSLSAVSLYLRDVRASQKDKIKVEKIVDEII